MDVALQPAPKHRTNLIIAGLVLATLVVSAWTYRSKANTVARAQVQWIVAEQGNIEFDISAYGKLVSSDQKFIASPALATVEQIYAQPGETVGAGQALIRLSSKELNRSASLAESLLGAAQMELRNEELAADVSDIEELGKVGKLERQLIIERAEQKAYRTIAQKGAVSELEMGRVDARVATAKAELRDQKNRRELLARVSRAKVAAKKEQVTQARARLAIALQAVEALTVRPPEAVTVQEIFITQGQAVQVGEKLLVISAGQSLLARLNVAQTRASSVVPGAKSVIELQNTNYQGLVVRVDPRVREGSVQVDVMPSAPLPSWAKGDLSVTATISAKGGGQSIFVRRVPEAAPFTQRDIFVLAGAELKKRQIRFGAESGVYLEVVTGLRVGEKMASGVPLPLYQYDALQIQD